MTHDPREALEPCPFCGGEAERIDIPTVGSDPDLGGDPNAGGSCIQCKRCTASTALHFDRKENLYSSWNDRMAGVAEQSGAGAPETSVRCGAPAALTASPGEQEPCGWQFCCPDGKWIGCDEPPANELRDEPEKFRRVYLSPPPAAGWGITDDMVEDACKAYADATGYYVQFHRGLSSESSDKMRKGMRAALEALRREAPAPEGVAPTHIDSGGRAVIEGGDVVIRFPLDAMQSAIDGAWSLKVFDTRYKITNIDEFSKEFVYALNREDEQGTTNIHRLADKAFIDCIESGAFGIEEHEQQEI